MSAKITGQLWDYRLSTTERMILMALADRCDHDGSEARPSVARLVWMTNISEREVYNTLADLKARGVLTVTRKAGYHRPTEYQIVLNSLVRKMPFTPAGDKGARPAPMKGAPPAALKGAEIG